MRIIYGLAGDGMGHATRSMVMINELKKEHQVKILCSGKSYPFLKDKFEDVMLIGGFHIAYRNNQIKRKITFLENLYESWRIYGRSLKIIKAICKFKPDVMITDFEPFTAWLALLFHKPLISIDNQHIFLTKLDLPHRLDWIIARGVIGAFIPKAKYYLVTTFFFPKNTIKRLFLVPPIIRPQVLALKPKEKNYILVYQTSTTNKDLISNLKKIKENFIVYGFNKNAKEQNITFREFSETRFLQELAECKAVIANGGLSMISEAIYLKKPILSIPIKKAIEQCLNAYYIEKLGYGKCCKTANKKEIKEFLGNLPKYKQNLKTVNWEPNKDAIKKLKELIKKK